MKVDSIYNINATVDGQGDVVQATNSIYSVLEWGWINYLSTTDRCVPIMMTARVVYSIRTLE